MDKLDLIKVKNFLLQKSSLWIWKVKPLTGRKWSVGGSVMLIPHDPMDCCLPDSSVHGILQVRILEWVAIPFSRGSSQPRDRTWVSCTAGRFFTIWATREDGPSSFLSQYSHSRSLEVSDWSCSGHTTSLSLVPVNNGMGDVTRRCKAGRISAFAPVVVPFAWNAFYLNS